MADQRRSALGRFFVTLWTVVDTTRKVVLNLAFLLILFLVIAALRDSGERLVIQPQTALVLNPQGDVVEEYSGTPFDQALQRATSEMRHETRLRDLTEAIRRARDEPNISRLIIDPSYLTGIGMASLTELEAAIADFRTSGKPVIAVADDLAEGQYFLAALADEIWLHPEGRVWIDGFAVYRNFFRDALEKLEVEVNLFRAGEYKSAAEPFVLNRMSDEDREANRFWLASLWQQYLESISRQRGVPLVDLSSAINEFADRLDAADGNFARMALELGLVDRIVGRAEAEQELARLGAAAADRRGYRHLTFDDFVGRSRLRDLKRPGSKVAVVVAEGEILRGYHPPGRVGDETLAERLNGVAGDETVRAVVLRINSPGGDPLAAEKIRLRLQALKEAGKTVVVSMGDLAASGGYWIALGADEVWASPATLTGSIGVFGLLPTFSRPLENLGIHTDGVGTTPLAGKSRLDLPLDDDLRRIYQLSVEQVYRDFITLVSQHRGLTPEEADEVARGRVWSGQQAKERGLVDQTGTLREAIGAAARIAGLGDEYVVEYAEAKVSALEAFLLDMTSSAAARIGFAGGPGRWRGESWWEGLRDDVRLLMASGDGFTLAAHCLCRSP